MKKALVTLLALGSFAVGPLALAENYAAPDSRTIFMHGVQVVLVSDDFLSDPESCTTDGGDSGAGGFAISGNYPLEQLYPPPPATFGGSLVGNVCTMTWMDGSPDTEYFFNYGFAPPNDELEFSFTTLGPTGGITSGASALVDLFFTVLPAVIGAIGAYLIILWAIRWIVSYVKGREY